MKLEIKNREIKNQESLPDFLSEFSERTLKSMPRSECEAFYYRG